MIVYDAAGSQLTLNKKIGRGSEAAIFTVQGRAEQVAKLYHTYYPEYEEKLRWMMVNPPAPAAGVLWPQQLLYSAQARFVGFLMPRLAADLPLSVLWESASRRTLHQAAHHLAKSVEALHARGYVLGNLSPTKLLATPSGDITLIDVDSYQVRISQLTSSALYPAQVGHPDYMPPERQGQREPTELPPSHDRFALAVLLFQLLMEGFHPFAGRWGHKGPTAPLTERIIRGWYPHAVLPVVPLRPLPEAPPLETLHPRLAALFERCFVEGHREPALRPTPTEWAEALVMAEQSLVPCEKGHYHGHHLRACPDCRRAAEAAKQLQSAPTPQKLIYINHTNTSSTLGKGEWFLICLFMGAVLFMVSTMLSFLKPSAYAPPAYRSVSSPFPALPASLDRGSEWLDLSFGTSGLVTTDFGRQEVARVLLLQPDGSLVAAGDAGSGFALARYLPDGSLDASFGSAGRVVTDFGDRRGILLAAVLQPDGRIVAAGQVGSDFAVVRYNSDGSLDSGFGRKGVAIINFQGSTSWAAAIVMQPDGKVVAAGTRYIERPYVSNVVLVRYEADGSLDPSFGTNGRVVIEVEEGQTTAYSLLLHPDGKLLVGGTLLVPTERAYPVAFLSRYRVNGAPDNEFFGDKSYGTYKGSLSSHVLDLALQPDGKVLVAGDSSAGRVLLRGLLLRYDDSRIDQTFGSSALRPSVDGLSLRSASRVVLQPDGKILITATADTSKQRFVVLRYLDDGSLDRSFGDAGVVDLPTLGGTVYDLVVQSDGAIVVAGRLEEDFALIRLKAPAP